MRCRLGFLGWMIAICLSGCGQIEEKVPTGTWMGQTAGMAGPGSFREVWTFQHGQITTEGTGTYKYTIDTTTNPKQIDMTLTHAGKDERVRLGIYKIEQDTLTICALVPSRAKDDAKRPADFYPTERDDVMTITLRRKS